MRKWLKTMSGSDIEIQKDGSGNGIVIRKDPSLGEEGSEIAVRDGQLIFSGGTTRGVVNAVYALLEEDLGCRFYTNESIRVAHLDALKIAAIPRKYVPQLRVRDPFYKCAFDPVWSLRNRT